jgi:hypothetical protein
MTSTYTQPVRAELLAAKIDKLKNFELPRLFDEFAAEPRSIEALWFLQYVSCPQNYAGGLNRFAADLIDSEQNLIGTDHMRKIGLADSYQLRDAVKVLREVPGIVREELFGNRAERGLFEETYLRSKHRNKPSAWDDGLVQIVTPAAVRNVYVEAARSELAGYFKELCEMPHVGFRPATEEVSGGAPWYFPKVADALLEFIDRRREALRSRIAETEITQLVSRWMTTSRNTKRAVMISGNSRFGKTEAVKLFAEMNPGRCRLVNTPATNALGDLLREVAKSLGIEIGPQNAGHDLRERIDYVLRFSHLQLCFDESQLLLPAAFSRNTAPARLNWVRRSVMDQGIPAVFVCTPQSYLPAKRRFVKATGFAMEQFDERILKTVHLPEELSECDLLAVARIHFDDLSDEYLHYVVDKALATERNYISDIEKIAALAKDNAQEHGRKLPTLSDINAAISDVLPTRPGASPAAPGKPSIQAPCIRDAKLVQASCAPLITLPQNRRETRLLAIRT